MPKVNVYLPDKLAKRVKDLEVPLSATTQGALEAAVAKAMLDRYGLVRFTPRLLRVLEAAAELAEGRGLNYVGVEHLQLAILDTEDSVPGRAIAGLGMTERLRADIYNLMSNSQGSNRVADPTTGDILGWLVEGGPTRLDGTRIDIKIQPDGRHVAIGAKGKKLRPIPSAEAPYIVDVGDDGVPYVIVDADGKHTGKTPRRH